MSGIPHFGKIRWVNQEQVLLQETHPTVDQQIDLKSLDSESDILQHATSENDRETVK